MRSVALLFTFSILAFAVAQAELKQPDNSPAEPTPTTLAEAHIALEQIFSADELARIDSMKSEDEMWEYHIGLGMWMRNNWSLWRGGPLATQMQKLGFNHPDDMSGIILATFWCKRHGKDFQLKQ
jgi:hypothetical protein